MTIELIYTIQDCMEILKVSMATVTAELTSGRLKHFRVGRQYRITESSLQSYIRGEFTPQDFSRDTEEITPIEPEPVSQEVATDPPTAEQPVQELGTNLFGDVDTLPITAEPIELILKLKADGMAYPAIAEHLNGMGIKTAKGCAWTKATVENNVRLHRKKSVSEVMPNEKD